MGYGLKIKLILAFSVIASLWIIQSLSKAGFCSEWWMALPPAIGLMVVTWGVTQIRSQFFVPATCRFTPEGKQIMLTFDDGPHPERTPQILDMLEKYGAKAIFFLIGKRVDAHPDMAARVAEKGHEIGSHAYHHGYTFDFLPAYRVKEELLLTEKSIKKATGREVRLFRPPYGITNPNIAKALESFNYEVLGWNIRSLDTLIRDPQKLSKRVLKRIQPGSIILFHDHGPATLQALEQVLDYCRKNGYETILPDSELT
jgi:peptidoglycan/xylan/chitin deacetylase (PgdA/CDA1 family)